MSPKNKHKIDRSVRKNYNPCKFYLTPPQQRKKNQTNWKSVP